MNPLDQRWEKLRDRWPLRVKNSSGSTIPPFSVVLITSVTNSSSTNNENLYTVRQPNAADTDFNWSQYLVTGPFTIGSGSSNEGVATDLTTPNFVRYNDSSGSITPAAKQHFGPKHGQFTLEKYYYGFEIVGGNTTFNSNPITIARWVGISTVKGKIDDTNVNALATCTVSVWDGNRAGDTTMNITGVVNPTSNLTSVNGKRCQVSFPGGVPELIFVQC